MFPKILIFALFNLSFILQNYSEAQICDRICNYKLVKDQTGYITLINDTNKVFSDVNGYYFTDSFEHVVSYDTVPYQDYLKYKINLYNNNDQLIRSFVLNDPRFSDIYFLNNYMIIGTDVYNTNLVDYVIIPFDNSPIRNIKSYLWDFIGKNDKKVYFKLLRDDTIHKDLKLKANDIVSMDLKGIKKENQKVLNRIKKTIPNLPEQLIDKIFNCITAYNGKELVLFHNNGFTKLIEKQSDDYNIGRHWIIAMDKGKIIFFNKIFIMPKPILFWSSNNNMIFKNPVVYINNKKDTIYDIILYNLNSNNFETILSRLKSCKNEVNLDLDCRIIQNRYILIQFWKNNCETENYNDRILLYDIETKKYVDNFTILFRTESTLLKKLK